MEEELVFEIPESVIYSAIVLLFLMAVYGYWTESIWWQLPELITLGIVTLSLMLKTIRDFIERETIEVDD